MPEAVTQEAITSDYTEVLLQIYSVSESIYSLQFLTTVVASAVLLCMMMYYILKKFF